MKMGVISDTHGDQEAIRQIVKSATDIDMWLHAGDCSQDADYLMSLVKVPVVSVKGNCDGQTKAKLDEFVEEAGYNIWVTHGHRYSVKQGIGDLLQVAKHHNVNVSIYGHTHVADNRWHDGILFFNPGSATCSYGSRGTYGILEIDDKQIVGKIIAM